MNSQAVTSLANPFQEHKVIMPTPLLKVGELNVVSIAILNKYRNDGHGLHSFTDRKDGQQYLYTQFETDFCHYVFPCFEQPSMKATFTLRA